MALGTICGIPGLHKFHCLDIPENWFKVEVKEVFHGGVALMLSNAADDAMKVADVKENIYSVGPEVPEERSMM